MEWKLIGFQTLLAIFAVIIIILSVTSVYPALSGDVDIDIPEEDEVYWNIDNGTVEVQGTMWINNSGYYDLNDIDIDVSLEGLEKELFNDSISVEKVEAGEDRSVILSLQRDTSDFTEGDLETIVFEETTFSIIADMKAVYPFSLLEFNLDYDSSIDWAGIVEDIQYYEEDISIEGTEQGSRVSIPLDVDTTDQLNTTSTVDLTLKNETDGDNYSETQISVPIGGDYSTDVTFELGNNETEHLIFNDEQLHVESVISIEDLGYTVTNTTIFNWEAPVRYIDFLYEQARVESVPTGSELFLPYNVSTTDRLSGLAQADITMYNSDQSVAYNETREMIPLGVETSSELEFSLNESETEKFITNSHQVNFIADINLQEKNIDFTYESSYDWGAPLNNLSIGDFSYDLITETISANISFINDSPRELLVNLTVLLFNSQDDLVGSKEISYTDDQDYRVASGEQFSQRITVDVSEEPSYAEVTFTDATTGMELEKVVRR